jgi:hypothetical protein
MLASVKLALVLGAVLLAAAPAPAAQRPNITFDSQVALAPIWWDAQPSLLIAFQGMPRFFVTFHNPSLGYVNVGLRIKLAGVMDSRACVEDPLQPMKFGYGPWDYSEPWYNVRMGMNFYSFSEVLRFIPLEFATPWYAGSNSRLGYQNACGGEPEMVFFIVTPELL